MFSPYAQYLGIVEGGIRHGGGQLFCGGLLGAPEAVGAEEFIVKGEDGLILDVGGKRCRSAPDGPLCHRLVAS
jgi:hypothetical protein